MTVSIPATLIEFRTSMDLITLIIRIAYGLLAVLAVADYLRYRGQARLDIALVFLSLGLPVLLQGLADLAGIQPLWLGSLVAFLLLAQPYLLLRVARYFHPVRPMIQQIALVGLLLAWLAVVTFNLSGSLLPVGVTLLLVLYFVIVEGYATLIFLRGARTATGINRRRLLLASFASGMLGLAILFAGMSTGLPALESLILPLDQLLAVTAAIAFYLGFSPPRSLRRAWQLSELYRFLDDPFDQYTGDLESEAIHRLVNASLRAVGGIAAYVAVWDPARDALVLRDGDERLKGFTLPAGEGLVGRAWQERRELAALSPDEMGKDGLHLAAILGAQGMLVAPVAARERAWGLLLVFLRQPSLFVQDDLSFLGLLAEQSARDLDYAALLAEQSGLIDQLQLLNQTLETRVTERTAALQVKQRDLQESEARMRAIVETAVDPIITIDEDRCIQAFNPAAERVFGYSAVEVIGQNVKLLMPSPYHEEHDRYVDSYLKTGAKNIIGIGREVTGKRQDGSVFPMDLAVSEVRLGDRRMFTGIIRDITGRKQAETALRLSEERFSKIFRASPVGISIINPVDERILDVNDAFLNMFGYSREEVIGRTSVELGLWENQEDWKAILQALREKGIVRDVETHFRTKVGETGVALMFAEMVDLAGQKTMLILRHDITARKRGEEALAARNEEIKAMSQQLWQAAKLATMGELAASIAHEINNPLATVSLRVESLLGQISAEHAWRHPLEVIEQEVERMGNLVANLLQFSRYSPKQISSIDIREEITKTQELVAYHLRNRQIAFVREDAPDVPLIQADRQQIRQLLLNLFTNASDAMLDGGILTVRVGVEDKNVTIEVSDTGMGISAENMARVMDPFFTTKPEGKGTGLGLAICRRIVQEHGGTLELFSEGVPGLGTTVRVTLPGKNGWNRAYLNQA